MKKNYFILVTMLLSFTFLPNITSQMSQSTLTLNFNLNITVQSMQSKVQFQNLKYPIVELVKLDESNTIIAIYTYQEGENVNLDIPAGSYAISFWKNPFIEIRDDNNGQGYIISESNPSVVVNMTQFIGVDVYADIPWRIESGNTIPIVNAVSDTCVGTNGDYDLANIKIYDYYGNSDRLVYTLPVNKFNPGICTGSIPPAWYEIVYLSQGNFFQDATGIIKIHVWFETTWYDDSLDRHVYIALKVGSSLPHLPNWYAGDQHVHTWYTDNPYENGAVTEGIVQAGRAFGLDYVITADHSYNSDAFQIVPYYTNESDMDSADWNRLGNEVSIYDQSDFLIIRGEETTIKSITPGDFNGDGHFLTYGTNVFTSFDFMNNELYFIKNNGGFGYIAHPNDAGVNAWDFNQLDSQYWENPIKGLEIWNYSETKDYPNQSAFAKWREQLLSGRHIYAIGNSDAHAIGHDNPSISYDPIPFPSFSFDYSYFGGVRTYVYASSSNEANILSALRNGNSIITSGPLLTFTADGAKIGSSISISQSGNVNLYIQGAVNPEYSDDGYIHMYLQYGTVDSTWSYEQFNDLGYLYANPSGSSTYSFNVSNLGNRSGYIRLEGYTYKGGKVYWAFTNPIWVNVTQQTIPNPPSNLTATAASQNQINLSWTDNSSDESGFRIYNASSGALIATVGANVTSYSHTSLACGTTYSYYLRAYNGNGESAVSNTASATTQACPPNVPNPPSNLTATTASQSQINLSWSDNSSNESGFRIYNASSGALIATVGANVTTYQNTGLACNTSYSYIVKAYNGNGESSASNTAGATTQACPPNTPNPPSGLTATTASQSQINLSWSDNSSNESGFRIYRNGAYLTAVSANTTSYPDSGLVCGTNYSYYVTAYNGNGESSPSNTAGATTQACSPTAPNPPSGLIATAVSTTQINLSWTDNSTNEIGFKIYRNGAYLTDVNANSTSYPDTGLSCGTTYSYYVTAYNGVGESSPTYTVGATTQACPPSNVNFTISPNSMPLQCVTDTSVTLTITNNSGIEYYNVLWQSDGPIMKGIILGGIDAFTVSPGVTSVERRFTCQNGTHMLETGILNTSLTFFNGIEWQIISNIVPFTITESPPNTPPNPPSDLMATTVSQSQINLSWGDNSNNENGFKIYRNSTLIATVGANVTSYSDTGLACYTYYTYYVTAYNDAGESAGSNSGEAMTQACSPTAPNPPSGLTATTVSQSQINLSWTDNSTNESGFRIYRNDTFIANVWTDVTNYQDAGLACGATYSYYVKAWNDTGESAASNTANATTQACPPPSIPNPPSGFTATAVSTTQINLSWTDNSLNESGFRIYRNSTLMATVGANVTSYSDTGLACEMNYNYIVKAYNDAGESNGSDVNAKTYDCPSPFPKLPSNLVAIPVSQTQIYLSWNDNSTNENGFRIYRNGVLIGNVDANVTYYQDNNLSCGTSYYYYVTAYNGAGESAQSSISSTTTYICSPSNPSNLVATSISQSQINLSWSDNSLNEKGFKIYRNSALIATVGVNVTSYQDTGLLCGTNYSYYTITYNDGGNSSASNTSEATTYSCSSNPPILSNDGVSPSSGDISTIFTYTVTYTDPKGTAPIKKNVVIDGNAYEISCSSCNYSTGVVFTFQITLTTGSHNYYFQFSDETSTVTTRNIASPTVSGKHYIIAQKITSPFSISGPQRSSWYDGSYFWFGLYDYSNSMYRFYYSTDNGITWIENANAKIQNVGQRNENSFSVWNEGDSVWIVYTDVKDNAVKVKSGISSSASFPWGTEYTVHDYLGYYPYISKSSDNYFWISATNTSGYAVIARSNNANDITSWPTNWTASLSPTPLSGTLMGAGLHRSAILPLEAGKMLCILNLSYNGSPWSRIERAVYDGSSWGPMSIIEDTEWQTSGAVAFSNKVEIAYIQFNTKSLMFRECDSSGNCPGTIIESGGSASRYSPQLSVSGTSLFLSFARHAYLQSDYDTYIYKCLSSCASGNWSLLDSDSETTSDMAQNPPYSWEGPNLVTVEKVNDDFKAFVTSIAQNSNLPRLSNGNVSPQYGNSSQTYTYSVTYIDPKNADLAMKSVIIDGTPYDMSCQSCDYIIGAVFTYSTTLNGGNHNYSFQFSNGTNTINSPSSGTFSGPNVNYPGNGVTTYIPNNDVKGGTSNEDPLILLNRLEQHQSQSTSAMERSDDIRHSLYDSGGGIQIALLWLLKISENVKDIKKITIMHEGYSQFENNIMGCYRDMYVKNSSGNWDKVAHADTHLMNTDNIMSWEYSVDPSKYITGNIIKIGIVTCKNGSSVGQGTYFYTDYWKTDIYTTSPPTLEALNGVTVNPVSGTISTMFNFTVKYKDPEGLPPTEKNVVIDGEKHIMECLAPCDISNGATYTFSTLLTTGRHTYHFEFNDGAFPVRLPSAGDYINPFVDSPFELYNGKVDPIQGDTFTQFTFSVIYRDPDNATPKKSQVVIDGKAKQMTKSGNDFKNGVEYNYATTLLAGHHNYYFLFSDDKYSLKLPASEEYQGPDVKGDLNTIISTDSYLYGMMPPQRSGWLDWEKFWFGIYDYSGGMYRFYYSIDGISWAENTNAQIPNVGKNSYNTFSVWNEGQDVWILYESSSVWYIAYGNSKETSFSWSGLGINKVAGPTLSLYGFLSRDENTGFFWAAFITSVDGKASVKRSEYPNDHTKWQNAWSAANIIPAGGKGADNYSHRVVVLPLGMENIVLIMQTRYNSAPYYKMSYLMYDGSNWGESKIADDSVGAASFGAAYVSSGFEPIKTIGIAYVGYPSSTRYLELQTIKNGMIVNKTIVENLDSNGRDYPTLTSFGTYVFLSLNRKSSNQNQYDTYIYKCLGMCTVNSNWSLFVNTSDKASESINNAPTNIEENLITFEKIENGNIFGAFSKQFSSRGTIRIESNIPNAPFYFVVFKGDAGYVYRGDTGDLRQSIFNDIPPGEYTIAWEDVEEYITPTPSPQMLDFGGTITFYGNYELASSGIGNINVNANIPDVRFTISGITEYAGITEISEWTQNDVPVGTYTVTWTDVSGFVSPTPSTQTLTEGGTITFSGDYSNDSQGSSIYVVSDIPNASFTINGPAFYSGDAGISGWTQSEIPSGTYAIVWEEINGYVTPAPSILTIEEGKVVMFTGDYVPDVQQVGTINVNSNIPNSQFTISGAAEYSGNTESAGWIQTNALIGEYTLEWEDVPGYLKPVSETQTLHTGETIIFSGNYVTIPQSGTIYITSNMPNAEFSISGVTNYAGNTGTSGWTQSGVPIGEYTIIWHDISDFITPAPSTQTIINGGIIVFNGEYVITKQTGTISVTSNIPNSPFTINGPTSYSGNTGSSMTWSVADASAGTYTITWQDVSGYVTPASSYQILAAGETITFSGIYVFINNPPTLSNGSVSPSSGNTSTTFTYSTTYADPEGVAPTIKNVVIDGSAYAMNYSSGNYGSGAVFILQKTLTAGSHAYSFQFSDGVNSVNTQTYSGPTVNSINSPPTLSSGSVSPAFGYEGSRFTYTVLYADPEGTAPTAKNVVIDGTAYTMSYSSGNYSSGAIFKYSISLNTGVHSYYFVFSDGTNTVRLPSSGTKTGPTVRRDPRGDIKKNQINSSLPIFPQNGQANVCPLKNLPFDWPDSIDMASITYQMQISNNSDFTEIVHDSGFNIIQSDYIYSGILSANMTYYWRVRARNSGVTLNWSETWIFTTGACQEGFPLFKQM